ncbi:hypothetical protein LOF14_15610 [Klebsiella variicola subsp. variicola]|nr:hypothetical protein LOF14_15610 [Klebsiella variicola subsp. variicola]
MNTSPFLDLTGTAPVECNMFVNGQWLPASTMFNVVSPSLNQVIARVASADNKTARLAVQAASDALLHGEKLPLMNVANC